MGRHGDRSASVRIPDAELAVEPIEPFAVLADRGPPHQGVAKSLPVQGVNLEHG